MPKKLTAQLEIPESGLPPASAANFFHFTHQGGDFQMLIGYVDPYLLGRRKEKAEQSGKNVVAVLPEISHRVLLSVRSFLYLRSQVEDMFQKLQKAEILTVDPAPKDSSVASDAS